MTTEHIMCGVDHDLRSTLPVKIKCTDLKSALKTENISYKGDQIIVLVDQVEDDRNGEIGQISKLQTLNYSRFTPTSTQYTYNRLPQLNEEHDTTESNEHDL